MADETPDPRIEAIARALHDMPDPDETTWPAAVQALDELDAELREARVAIGEAWFADAMGTGVTLAEAIERKTRALERAANRDEEPPPVDLVEKLLVAARRVLEDLTIAADEDAGEGLDRVLSESADRYSTLREAIEALDERDYGRWLAETARECRACDHFGSPCGGCSAGGVCDGVCQQCEDGDLEDQLDRAMGWDEEADDG